MIREDLLLSQQIILCHSISHTLPESVLQLIILFNSQHVSDAYCSAHRHGYQHIELVDINQYPRDVVRKPSFMISPNNNNNNNNTKPILQMYHLLFERLRPSTTPIQRVDNPMSIGLFKNMQQTIDKILTETSINSNQAIFIINFGLHEHDKDEYVYTLDTFIRYLINNIMINKQHIVFFRETSAQHFKTLTGEFPWNDKSFSWTITDSDRVTIHNNVMNIKSDQLIITNNIINNNNNKLQQLLQENHKLMYTIRSEAYHCSHPLQYNEQYWKNQVMYDKLHEYDHNSHNNANKLFNYLLFWNITIGRYDAHSRVKKDCTHYCNNPMLYLPLYDGIVKVLKQL